MGSVLQDLLEPELMSGFQAGQITVSGVTDLIIERAGGSRGILPPTKSAGDAKSLLEVYDLIRQAIENYEMRARTTSDSKVNYTEEEPETTSQTETITFSLVKRVPGGFGRGAPLEADVRNLRPIVREIKDDPTNPGYRLITLGYWHENIIRLTCWARTNKAANARALWLEGLMANYDWWFVLSGVNRLIYQGQGTDLVEEFHNNRWYGRPIDYYVKTEKLVVFSEKTLESVLIELGVSGQ
jgi:hypothetical protein